MDARLRAGRTRLGVLSLLVAVGALSGPPVGAAEKPPPADVSAIAVYVEQIPTSTGAVVPGQKSSGPAKAQLSAPASAALERQGGDDSAILERVATSPELGAPVRVVPADVGELEPERTAFPDVRILVADGSSRIPWLLAALALITGALTAAWAARRRPR